MLSVVMRNVVILSVLAPSKVLASLNYYRGASVKRGDKSFMTLTPDPML